MTPDDDSFEKIARELCRELRLRHIRSLLLGLSGGADSVLTFHLLRRVAEINPDFHFGVAHANFNLRGDESMRDQNFVAALLNAFPSAAKCWTRSFDTERFCAENHLSTEMGARRLRHEWFDEIVAREAYDRIATGHNADDNEETLLMNLLRGAGTSGLRGMQRDNQRVFRPILRLTRDEVRRMAAKFSFRHPDFPEPIAYITDSSNLTDDYRRNFLRHKVIPLLEERWQGTHTALQTTLQLMTEESAIVERAVGTIIARHTDALPNEEILNFASPLTLIYRWTLPYGGTPSRAAEIARAIARRRFGARWILSDPSGECHEFVVTTSALRRKRIDAQPDSAPHPITGDYPPPTAPQHFIKGSPDYDSIIASLRSTPLSEVILPGVPADYEWRHPEAGQRMRISTKATKLISDILKENGIPVAMRPRIWMLCSRTSGHPVWIPGIRRAADSLIQGSEPRIFRLTLQPLRSASGHSDQSAE